MSDLFGFLQQHYLSLVESTIVGTLYEDVPLAASGATRYDPQLREYGADWPSKAFSMIGTRRLRNFRAVIESVIGTNISGDIVEAGVWRGGASIMARAVLAAYGVTDRRIVLADSFAGLPAPNAQTYPADANSTFHTYQDLAVPLEEVKRNFDKFGLLDNQVVFLPGWFKDTLPSAPVDCIAVLRLDADMYESTMQALETLYDKVSPNGWIVIDDYEVVPACRAAVSDFLAARSLAPDIFPIDGVGVFFRKPSLDEAVAAPSTHVSSIAAPTSLPIASDVAVVRVMAEGLIRSAEQFARARIETGIVQNEAKILATELEQLRSQLEGQQAARLQSQERAESLAAQIKSLSLKLSETEKCVETSRAEAAASKRSLQLIYESPSWRMTAAYRALESSFRRLFQQSTAEQAANKISKVANAGSSLPSVVWTDEKTLRINSTEFFVTFDDGEMRSTNSTPAHFLLAKSRSLVDRVVLWSRAGPLKNIVDIGIFKGGSVVLYDQLFQPTRLVALEYTQERVEALTRYVAENDRSQAVKPVYGVDQADARQVGHILATEFPLGDIDLVVDDASHLYEQTRASFNSVFPYIRAGGRFVLEDWGWAHWAGDAWENNAYFAGRRALSNLVVEFIMLSATRPDLIANISIDHESVVVTKGEGFVPLDGFELGDYYKLHGKEFKAFL